MTLVSLILIFIIHNLINFFKSTLTVPKIKDLVNNPNKQYDDIYNIISSQNIETSTQQTNFNKNKFSYNDDDLLPKSETDMKNELKNFLKKQLYSTNEIHEKNSNYDTTDLSMLDSIKTHSYSSY